MIYHFIIDVMRILKNGNFFSRKRIKKVSSNHRLRILGNGSSLNRVDFESEELVDYMVVNRHVLSENYIVVKPLYYVLADPHFFQHSEGLDILQKINEKTDWRMTLCVPYSREIKQKVLVTITNSNINLLYYNTTSLLCESKCAKYLCYKWQLAMPVVQNVLVASIMLGILFKYSNIELYGVEHTWTKYLFVDKDNVVYLENPHFFDEEKVTAKPVKEIQHTEEYPFYLILKNYARMFESYWEIKEYIRNCHIQCRIINKTKDSFIDAFVKEF